MLYSTDGFALLSIISYIDFKGSSIDPLGGGCAECPNQWMLQRAYERGYPELDVSAANVNTLPKAQCCSECVSILWRSIQHVIDKP